MLKLMTVRTTVAAILTGLSMSAYAIADTQRLNIPAGSLLSALETLAEQANVDLVYQDAQVQGLRTGGVRGELSARDAVIRLLQGTPLEVRSDKESGAILIAAPTRTSSATFTGASGHMQLAQVDPLAGQPRERPAAPAPIESERAADAATGSPITEVIVTAQRRAERLQDVPIAISALSADALARQSIETVSDLQGKVPGLSMSGFAGINGTSLIALRGVAGQPAPIGASQATAVYLDGVYLSRPDAGFFGLKDVERIEVLRGPQGTLYGRNATAGAINIITRTPTESPEGTIDISYGNAGTMSAGGYVSGPIAGNLTGSFSGTASQHDGYYRNAPTGNTIGDGDSYSGRIKLQYDTGTGVDFTLAGDHTRRTSEDLFVFVGLAKGRSTFPTDTVVTNLENETGTQIKSGGIGLTINADLTDNVTLTSITSWRTFDYTTVYDIDGTAATVVHGSFMNENDTLSQELRGLISSDRLRLTIGANYYREEGEAYLRINPLNYTISQLKADPRPYTNTDVRALAAFTQVEYDVLDTLTLVGGLRFNDEQRDFVVDYSSQGFAPIHGQLSDTVVVPMVGVNYKASPDALWYAKVSGGYQAPGYAFQSGPGQPADTFDAEDLRAYEIGVKSQLLDRRLTLNVAGFYYDYKDLQVRSLISAGLSRIDNAGAASIKGGEIELVFQPFDALTLNAQTTYSKAAYDSYCDGISPSSPAVNDPLCVGTPGPTADRSGNALNFAPEWSGGVGATYAAEIGQNMMLTLSGNYSFESQSYFNPPNERQASTGGYDRFNARVALKFANGLTAYAYGRNLADERHLVQSIRFVNSFLGVVSDPRIYGVGASYQF
jgi:iron complex outermembrane receptor protein